MTGTGSAMKGSPRSVQRAPLPYGALQARGGPVSIPRPAGTTAPAAAAYLQRTAGNRATAALLAGRHAPTTQPALLVARSPASDLVDKHSGWGNLDEEALGKELAAGLPGNADFVEDVIAEVGRNSDDVTMAIIEPLSDDELAAKLGPHPGLAQRMVIALQFGWTSGDEASVIERLIRVSSPTHDRLASEPWNASPAVAGAVAAVGGEIQSNQDGHGDLILDEYSVVMESMPRGLTPEAYLQEMSADINKAVHSDVFDFVNVFKRSPQAGNTGDPAVGDVYNINIAGPDNGSVVLAESAADHFVFQTVRTAEDGWHPEYGSRQFGFERRGPDGAVEWYTKGASRGGKLPGTGLVGRHMQRLGWSALIRGIAAELTRRGGTERRGSFWISDTHREDLGTSGRIIP
jgi:hypothetical protein